MRRFRHGTRVRQPRQQGKHSKQQQTTSKNGHDDLRYMGEKNALTLTHTGKEKETSIAETIEPHFSTPYAPYGDVTLRDVTQLRLFPFVQVLSHAWHVVLVTQ
jgi:hypothetical protein